MAAPDEWLSLHVFLADPAQQDRYLCEHLRPLVLRWRGAGELGLWFYIRYWEGGPHLRIRLQGALTERPQAAMDALARGLARYRSAAPPSRDDYYRSHAFDGVPLDPATLPWYPEGSVENIAYTPETLRYGGAGAMRPSEELFALSSRLALDLCLATSARPHARLPAAAALMAAALLASGESMAGAADYFDGYATWWAWHPQARRVLAAPGVPPRPALLVMLRDVSAQSAPSAAARTPTGAWADGVRKLMDSLARLHDATGSGRDDARRRRLHVLGSHIHMFNNRLGIVPAAECSLAASLAASARVLAGGATNEAGQP